MDSHFDRALADSELSGGVGLIGVAGEPGFEDVEVCLFVGCGMFFGQCFKREGQYGWIRGGGFGYVACAAVSYSDLL